LLVEMSGFEPPTSCLQSRRSPTELHPQKHFTNLPLYFMCGQGPCQVNMALAALDFLPAHLYNKQ
jgi:hypothetical protein